jgi:predicted ATPase with chaperone activity
MDFRRMTRLTNAHSKKAAVKESTHRIERALVNSGFQRPQDRIAINLAPAELPKQAASFDLPITLAFATGFAVLLRIPKRRHTASTRMDS